MLVFPNYAQNYASTIDKGLLLSAKAAQLFVINGIKLDQIYNQSD